MERRTTKLKQEVPFQRGGLVIKLPDGRMLVVVPDRVTGNVGNNKLDLLVMAPKDIEVSRVEHHSGLEVPAEIRDTFAALKQWNQTDHAKQGAEWAETWDEIIGDGEDYDPDEHAGAV